MTAQKEKDRIAELEKELAQVKEQNAGLVKRNEELVSKQKTQKSTKSRQQAEEGLKMLTDAGVAGCTKEQFATLNEKYPSDVAYYVKTVLHIPVERVGKRYLLPEHAAEVRKQEADKAAAAKAAKEATPAPAPAPAPAATPAPAKEEQTAAVAMAA